MPEIPGAQGADERCKLAVEVYPTSNTVNAGKCKILRCCLKIFCEGRQGAWWNAEGSPDWVGVSHGYAAGVLGNGPNEQAIGTGEVDSGGGSQGFAAIGGSVDLIGARLHRHRLHPLTPRRITKDTIYI